MKKILIFAVMFSLLISTVSYADIQIGVGPGYQNSPIVEVKDFKFQRLQYYIDVLNNMDEEDRIALQSVCYNESIGAWSGANYVNDHDYNAMILCSAGVVETVLNRLGSEQFGFKTKISKVCANGFCRYPTRAKAGREEFDNVIAFLIYNYENGDSILPDFKYTYFSTDCKVGHKKSSATSGRVTAEDTVWIGEYIADGSPRERFGHWYRRVF